MSDFTDSAQSKQINQVEHNSDAAAKRTVIRAQDPVSGDFFNIAAYDNGDGTFSLQTASTPVGGATEAEQDSQIDILNEIRSALQSVAHAKGVTADLRVTLLSGTVTTVTTVATVATVTTLSNITSIGGITATQVAPAIQNTNSVLSNINNVIIS